MGPGYVESEFQLYPFLIAAVMRVTGEAEYPGQVLSLLFIGLSAFVMYTGLAGYFGYGAGLAGMMVFLTAQGPVHLSTSIQPDALCFLFYAAGFFAFLKYMQETKISFLVWSTVFAVFAGLIKPTALNLCAIQFLIIIFKDSKQLRNPGIWCSWFVITGIVSLIPGAWLYALSDIRQYLWRCWRRQQVSHPAEPADTRFIFKTFLYDHGMGNRPFWIFGRHVFVLSGKKLIIRKKLFFG